MPDLRSMSVMCPKWDKVDKQPTWLKLWRAVVDCESSFNKYSWMDENMGIDPVTGKTVRSEGLLQLSYQDAVNYKTPECYKIDWSQDSKWGENSPQKTIFNAAINLNCGMSIAKKHLEWGSRWAFPPMAYWACLRQNTNGPAKFKKLAPECF